MYFTFKHLHMKKFYLFAVLFFATIPFSGFKNAEIANNGGEVIIINHDNFAKIVKKDIVVIDFWATWCHPCLRQAPIIDELSKEMKKVTFGKINVDKNRGLSGKFNIRSIPTLIIFKKGIEQERIIGLHDKATLKKIIAKYI